MRELCHLSDFKSDKVLKIALNTKEDVLLVKHHREINAFLNRCPHAFAKLDSGYPKLVAMDDYHLLCTMHGAQFNPQTGRCVLGPCKGRYLQSLDIKVEDDLIWLLEEPNEQ